MSDETRKNENEELYNTSSETTGVDGKSDNENLNSHEAESSHESVSHTDAHEENEPSLIYVPDDKVAKMSNNNSGNLIYVPDEKIAAKAQNAKNSGESLIYVPDEDVDALKNVSAKTEYTDGVAYTTNVDGNVTNCYEWNGTASQQPKNDKKKKKKSSSTGFKVLLTVMISIFTVSVIVLLGYGLNEIYKDSGKNAKVPEQNTNVGDLQTSDNFDYDSVSLNNPNYVPYEFKEYNSEEALSIPEIAAKCTPSSVGIVAESEYSAGYSFFYGYSGGVSQASGSGFIYSAEGYIITNHHVVENANKITIYLHDGSEYEAELVGSDSLSDIAVLKIEPHDGESFIPMEIGNSNELVVGESVVAIGCPAGVEFINTVTNGIVSSINRSVELTDDSGSVQKTMALIQTNATINHGNSGGPLINSRGQVIGINTLKLSSDYEGIGFAIPINGAVSIINQLIEYGDVIERTDEDFVYGKGIIGINGSDISEQEASIYKIPQGVLVVQIDKDSSASKAGLKRGDIITHFNGKEVKTVTELNNAKSTLRPGTEVSVTVYRDGDNNESETVTIKFKLDEQK